MAIPILRVETQRFGPFTFQGGVALDALMLEKVRVEDAWEMFNASPLAQVANQLTREVLVQSVYGTNTIEGADLTEEETGRALDLDPKRVQAEQDVRVRNIRSAYELAVRSSEDPAWQFSVEYVKAVHSEICRDLAHPDNRPGLFRDNPKERPTVVGDAAHGGQYKPPQFRGDIDLLMDALVRWHAQLEAEEVPALIRAPLVHLYFELIHPFWDGNGRVGRVLEATLLRCAGFRYAPFALAKFYQEQIHRYFALFNACRRAAVRGDANPNQEFVSFHLQGLREVIRRLHGRVNFLVQQLLFEAVLQGRRDDRSINTRQYAIVRRVMEHGRPLPIAALRADPIYRALYSRKTDKTRQRDLKKLLDGGLLRLDGENQLWPAFAAI